MKISAKKRSEIYSTIYEHIMDLRIAIGKKYYHDSIRERNLSNEIDCMIAKEEVPIFKEVMKVLEGNKQCK